MVRFGIYMDQIINLFGRLIYSYGWETSGILRTIGRVVEVVNEQAEALTGPYVYVSPLIEPVIPIYYLRIYNSGNKIAW